MPKFRAGSLPPAPLATAILKIAEREHRRMMFAGHAGAAHGRLRSVCQRAEVPERRISSWRRGESNVSWETADLVLTRLDLIWWDVWNEDTVRAPLFVVHRYSTQWKTVHGVHKRARVRTGSLGYGDAGPDYETLAHVERVMTGEVVAA